MALGKSFRCHGTSDEFPRAVERLPMRLLPADDRHPAHLVSAPQERTRSTADATEAARKIPSPSAIASVLGDLSSSVERPRRESRTAGHRTLRAAGAARATWR